MPADEFAHARPSRNCCVTTWRKGVLRIRMAPLPGGLRRRSEQAAGPPGAAGRQGRFWRFHDTAYARPRECNKGDFAEKALLKMAGEAGDRGPRPLPRGHGLPGGGRGGDPGRLEEGYALGVWQHTRLPRQRPADPGRPAHLDVFAEAIEAAEAAAEARAHRAAPMSDPGFVVAFLRWTAGAAPAPAPALLLPAFFAYSFTSRTRLLGLTALFYTGLCLTMVRAGCGELAGRAPLLQASRRAGHGGLANVVIALGVAQLLRAWGGSGSRRLQGSAGARQSSSGAVRDGTGRRGVRAGRLLRGPDPRQRSHWWPRSAVTPGGVGRCSRCTPWAAWPVPMFVLAALWDRFDLGRRHWLRWPTGTTGPVAAALHVTLLGGAMFIALGTVFLLFDGTSALPSPMGVDTGFTWGAAPVRLGDAVPDRALLGVLALVVAGPWPSWCAGPGNGDADGLGSAQRGAFGAPPSLPTSAHPPYEVVGGFGPLGVVEGETRFAQPGGDDAPALEQLGVRAQDERRVRPSTVSRADPPACPRLAQCAHERAGTGGAGAARFTGR